MKYYNNKNFLYQIVLLILLVVSLFLLWIVSDRVLMNINILSGDDFNKYWLAGQVHNEQGYFLYTLPWAFPLFYIFGLLPYQISRVLWLLLSIALLLGTANIIWEVYEGKKSLRWVSWVYVFTFGPTISVLEKGQIGPWIVYSLSAFLLLVKDKRYDFINGLLLFLAVLKPQLVFLFWPILFFWVILEKRWAIFFGLFVAIMGAFITALILRPTLIQEYISIFFIKGEVTDWATPTIGAYLRLFFGINYFWLQFVAPALGLIWVIWYWFRHYKFWEWRNQLPILLFISILTSPYSWTYDQVLLIPAILWIPSVLSNKSKNTRWLFFISISIVNMLDLLMHRNLNDFWFIWLAPAYFLWYLIGKWVNDRK